MTQTMYELNNLSSLSKDRTCVFLMDGALWLPSWNRPGMFSEQTKTN